jgi:hypothetical protein
MTQVWLVTTHSGHGEDSDVLGVFESREAAWDGLKGALPPDHKMWVGDDGNLRSKPENEKVSLSMRKPYRQRMYALGEPYEVEGRKVPEPTGLDKVRAAVRRARGGDAPVVAQGYA